MVKAVSIILLISACSLGAHGQKTAFQDDFSSGSGTLGTINGWTEQGPESKEYNVGSSGMLVVRDDNGDEKGTGAHTGYFDSIYADLGSTLSLLTVGEWIQLAVDFDIFTGSWNGAAVADITQGLRVSLTGIGWSAANVAEVGTAVVDDDFETVTNRLSTVGDSNGFVRLRIGVGE